MSSQAMRRAITLAVVSALVGGACLPASAYEPAGRARTVRGRGIEIRVPKGTFPPGVLPSVGNLQTFSSTDPLIGRAYEVTSGGVELARSVLITFRVPRGMQPAWIGYWDHEKAEWQRLRPVPHRERRAAPLSEPARDRNRVQRVSQHKEPGGFDTLSAASRQPVRRVSVRTRHFSFLILVLKFVADFIVMHLIIELLAYVAHELGLPVPCGGLFDPCPGNENESPPVEPPPAPGPAPPAPPPAPVTYPYQVAAGAYGGAAVRDTPSLSGKTLYVVPNGATVYVICKVYGEWAYDNPWWNRVADGWITDAALNTPIPSPIPLC